MAYWFAVGVKMLVKRSSFHGSYLHYDPRNGQESEAPGIGGIYTSDISCNINYSYYYYSQEVKACCSVTNEENAWSLEGNMHSQSALWTAQISWPNFYDTSEQFTKEKNNLGRRFQETGQR